MTGTTINPQVNSPAPELQIQKTETTFEFNDALDTDPDPAPPPISANDIKRNEAEAIVSLQAPQPKVKISDVRPGDKGIITASAYGPGLFGNQMANGDVLTPETIGVAHKSLPFGTPVAITFPNGNVVNATVTDRGPYEDGREFDITTGAIKAAGYKGSNGQVAANFGVQDVYVEVGKK